MQFHVYLHYMKNLIFSLRKPSTRVKEGRETSMLYLLRFLDDHTSRGQSDRRTSPMEVDTDALELTYAEILSLDFAENLLAAT